MKIFSSSHLFNYTWEQVTAANWQKYPNELSTHVTSVDILNRDFDLQRNVLRTERLITCKQSIPQWITYFIGVPERSFVREVSEVDLKHKTLVMKSHNLSFDHLITINETVMYRPDSECPASKTKFGQLAEINAYGSLRRICDQVENWSVTRFRQNANIGKLGFETVLERLTEKWKETGVFV